MGVRVGDEYICRMCGKICIAKHAGGWIKYCPECAYQRQLEQQRAYNKKAREQTKSIQKEAEAVKVPVVVQKPKYTLAEVAAAAKKHGMTYGKYVAAWQMGTVPEPEHIEAPKKKRGRKKKCNVT